MKVDFHSHILPGIDDGARTLEEKIDLPQDFAEGIKSVTREDICDAAKKVTLDTIYMLSGDGSSEEE